MRIHRFLVGGTLFVLSACSPNLSHEEAIGTEPDSSVTTSAGPSEEVPPTSITPPALAFDVAAEEWRELTALFDLESEDHWLESPFRSGTGIYSVMTLELFLGDQYEGTYGSEILVLAWNGTTWEPLRQIPCNGNPVHYGISVRLLDFELEGLPVFVIEDCWLGTSVADGAIEWDEDPQSVALRVVDGEIQEILSGSDSESEWKSGDVKADETTIEITNCVESEDAYYTEEATGLEIFAGIVCTRRVGEALTIQADTTIDRSTVDLVIKS